MPVSDLTLRIGLSCLCLATGILAYTMLAIAFNRTTLTVGSSQLQKQSRPFLWRSRLKVQKEEVAQYYIREIVMANPSVGSPGLAYNLELIDHKGGEAILLRKLPDPDVAKFIEYKLEQLWHMANHRVSGEYVLLAEDSHSQNCSSKLPAGFPSLLHYRAIPPNFGSPAFQRKASSGQSLPAKASFCLICALFAKILTD